MLNVSFVPHLHSRHTHTRTHTHTLHSQLYKQRADQAKTKRQMEVMAEFSSPFSNAGSKADSKAGSKASAIDLSGEDIATTVECEGEGDGGIDLKSTIRSVVMEGWINPLRHALRAPELMEIVKKYDRSSKVCY